MLGAGGIVKYIVKHAERSMPMVVNISSILTYLIFEAATIFVCTQAAELSSTLEKSLQLDSERWNPVAKHFTALAMSHLHRSGMKWNGF